MNMNSWAVMGIALQQCTRNESFLFGIITRGRMSMEWDKSYAHLTIGMVELAMAGAKRCDRGDDPKLIQF